MLLLRPAVLAAAAASGVAVYLWSCLTSPLYKIPGPWYSAFTSLMLQYHELKAQRTSYIHALHLVYGPAVRIAPNEAAFASVDSIKEIYASGGSGYDKTEFYNLFTVYGRRTMFSTLVRDDHAKRKRVLADRYANTNVQRSESIAGIHERAGWFLNRCTASVGGSIDIFIHLHNYAFDCVTHHLFHPYGSESLRNSRDEEIQKQVTFDDSLQNRLIKHHYPLLHHAAGSLLALLGAKPRETPLADDLVLSAAARPDPARFTVVSRMQEKKGDHGGGSGGLDHTAIAAECLDHMAAGIDTTGDALCFLMWELSQPRSIHVQRRLQQELRENDDSNSYEREETSMKKKKKRFDELPYLDAVVTEGLRCFPAIPMSLPRRVPAGGRTIGQYFVPAGAVVSCQAFSTHRIDQGVWPEPELFDPGRWLLPASSNISDQDDKEEEQEGGEAAEELLSERKKLFFAFANGGRGCIGKHLALSEMKILLQAIYSQFTTLPDEDSGMTDADMAMADQIISSQPRGKRCLLKMVPIDG